jgi:hypothetical protein
MHLRQVTSTRDLKRIGKCANALLLVKSSRPVGVDPIVVDSHRYASQCVSETAAGAAELEQLHPIPPAFTGWPVTSVFFAGAFSTNSAPHLIQQFSSSIRIHALPEAVMLIMSKINSGSESPRGSLLKTARWITASKLSRSFAPRSQTSFVMLGIWCVSGIQSWSSRRFPLMLGAIPL